MCSSDLEVNENELSQHGVIEPQKSQGRYIKVRSMVEKPVSNPPSKFAALGRYVLTPDIFNLLKTTIPGLDGDIQLTDALRRQKNLVAYNFVGKRYDVGTREGYLEAVIDFALHRDDMKDALKEYIKNKKIED